MALTVVDELKDDAMSPLIKFAEYWPIPVSGALMLASGKIIERMAQLLIACWYTLVSRVANSSIEKVC